MMKPCRYYRALALAALFAAVWNLSAASLNRQWVRYYTDTVSRFTYGVAAEDDGGLALAGSIPVDSNGLDVYVGRLDSAGNVLRERTFNYPADDEAFAIDATRDGGYVLTGYTRSFGEGEADILVMKLDPATNLQWRRTFGGAYDDKGYGIEQTADGGYVVAGTFRSGSDDNKNDIVLKLSPEGSVQWQTVPVGGPDTDQEAFCVGQTTDGGYIVTGYARGNNGSESVTLVKLFSDGGVQWRRFHGTTGHDERGFAVLEQAGGSFAIAGSRTPGEGGGGDGFVLQTDSQGFFHNRVRFQKGACLDGSYALVQTTENHLVLAGVTRSEGPSDAEAFWMGFDEDLNEIHREHHVVGTLYRDGMPLAATADSGFVLVSSNHPLGDKEQTILEKRSYRPREGSYPTVLYPFQEWFTCLQSLANAGFWYPEESLWVYDDIEQAMRTETPGGWRNLCRITTPAFSATRDSGRALIRWRVKLPTRPYLRWRNNNLVWMSLCDKSGDKTYTLLWKPNLRQHRNATADLVLYGGNDLIEIDILDKAWTHTTTPAGGDAEWLRFEMELDSDGTIGVYYDARDGRGKLKYMDIQNSSYRDFSSIRFQYKTGRHRLANYSVLIDDVDVRMVVEN